MVISTRCTSSVVLSRLKPLWRVVKVISTRRTSSEPPPGPRTNQINKNVQKICDVARAKKKQKRRKKGKETNTFAENILAFSIVP